MVLSSEVDAAAAAVEATLALRNPSAASHFSENIQVAPRAAGVTANAILFSPSRARAPLW